MTLVTRTWRFCSTCPPCTWRSPGSIVSVCSETHDGHRDGPCYVVLHTVLCCSCSVFNVPAMDVATLVVLSPFAPRHTTGIVMDMWYWYVFHFCVELQLVFWRCCSGHVAHSMICLCSSRSATTSSSTFLASSWIFVMSSLQWVVCAKTHVGLRLEGSLVHEVF